MAPYWSVGKKQAGHLLDGVVYQEFPRRHEVL